MSGGGGASTSVTKTLPTITKAEVTVLDGVHRALIHIEYTPYSLKNVSTGQTTVFGSDIRLYMWVKDPLAATPTYRVDLADYFRIFDDPATPALDPLAPTATLADGYLFKHDGSGLKLQVQDLINYQPNVPSTVAFDCEWDYSKLFEEQSGEDGLPPILGNARFAQYDLSLKAANNPLADPQITPGATPPGVEFQIVAQVFSHTGNGQTFPGLVPSEITALQTKFSEADGTDGAQPAGLAEQNSLPRILHLPTKADPSRYRIGDPTPTMKSLTAAGAVAPAEIAGIVPVEIDMRDTLVNEPNSQTVIDKLRVDYAVEVPSCAVDAQLDPIPEFFHLPSQAEPLYWPARLAGGAEALLEGLVLTTTTGDEVGKKALVAWDTAAEPVLPSELNLSAWASFIADFSTLEEQEQARAVFDLRGKQAKVKLRVRFTQNPKAEVILEQFIDAGVPHVFEYEVDNNAPPAAAPAQGGQLQDQRGQIALDLDVADAESDALVVKSLEWQAQGQSGFQPVAGRTNFSGVALPKQPPAADQVVLGGLDEQQAALLAAVDSAGTFALEGSAADPSDGAELELLRPNGEPVTLGIAGLVKPMAVLDLPAGMEQNAVDGLVLDQKSESAWQLLHVRLDTGASLLPTPSQQTGTVSSAALVAAAKQVVIGGADSANKAALWIADFSGSGAPITGPHTVGGIGETIVAVASSRPGLAVAIRRPASGLPQLISIAYGSFTPVVGLLATLADGGSSLATDPSRPASVVVATAMGLQVYDLDSGALQPLGPHNSAAAAQAVAISRDGRLLHLVDSGNVLRSRILAGPSAGSAVDISPVALPVGAAGLTGGDDGLIAFTLPATPDTREIRATGGVEQMRVITSVQGLNLTDEGAPCPAPLAKPTDTTTVAIPDRNIAVQLDAALNPALTTAKTWRIRTQTQARYDLYDIAQPSLLVAPGQPLAVPAGEATRSFALDASSALPFGGQVELRASAREAHGTDPGAQVSGSATQLRAITDNDAHSTFLPGKADELAVCDIDGDSIADLAVIDASSPLIRFARVQASDEGPGLALSALTADLADEHPTARPQAIAIGNFGGSDARPEIVVANANANELIVLSNPLDALVQSLVLTLPVGSSQPVDLALADFDDDGDLDVVSANAGPSATLTRFVNTVVAPSTTLAFAPGASLSLTGSVGASSVAAADLDADGDPELVAAVPGNPGSVVVFRGTPGATFGPAIALESSLLQAPRDAAVVDWNLDGMLDVACACPDSNTIAVLRATGTPNGLALTDAVAHASLAALPQRLVVADLDEDGQQDLVVRGVGSSAALFAASAAHAAGSSLVTIGSVASSLAVLDLEGDGDLDVAAGGAGFLRVVPTSSPAEFSAKADLRLSSPNYAIAGPVRFADLDGDWDRDELLVASVPVEITPSAGSPSTATVVAAVVVPQEAARRFSSALESWQVLGAEPNAPAAKGGGSLLLDPSAQVTLALDVNRDGALDALVGCATPSAITAGPGLAVYLQNPASGLLGKDSGLDAKPPVRTPDLVVSFSAGIPAALVAGDLDGSGDSELLVAVGSKLHLLAGDWAADGSQSAGAELFTAASAITSLTLADLDADGDLDVILDTAAGLEFAENTSAGLAIALTGKPQWPALAGAHAPAAGDVDGNGDIDLLCRNGNAIEFRTDPGAPPSVIAAGQTWSTGGGELALADVDADGDLDVLVSSLTQGRVACLPQLLPKNFDVHPLFVLQGIADPQSLQVVDLEGDGEADIAISGPAADEVSVFFAGR